MEASKLAGTSIVDQQVGKKIRAEDGHGHISKEKSPLNRTGDESGVIQMCPWQNLRQFLVERQHLEQEGVQDDVGKLRLRLLFQPGLWT